MSVDGDNATRVLICDGQPFILADDSALQAYTDSLPRASYEPRQAVEKKSRLLSNMIHSTFDRVRTLATKCGVEILPMISTLEGRKELLGRLEATVPRRSSPDFEPLKPDNQFLQLGEIPRKKSWKQACYLPHLNVEELLEGDNLHDLLLTKYVRNFPCDIIFSALELSHVNLYDLKEEDKVELYMAFRGRKSPATFGEVYDRATIGMLLQADALEDKVMPTAYAGLEMEGAVLEELRSIDSVWAAAGFDFDNNDLLKKPNKQMPVQSREVYEIESLGDISRVAPYRDPAKIDLLRLNEHVGAVLDAANTHFTDVQSDPGYLKEVLGGYIEHMPLLFRDWQGQAARMDSQLPSNDCLATFKMLKEAYGDIIWWTLLQQLIKDANFWMTAEAEAWEKCELSESCIMVFSQLDHVLEQMIAEVAYDVGLILPALEGMRTQYENYPAEDAEARDTWTVMSAILRKDARPDAAYLHRLIRLLFDGKTRLVNGAWHIAKAFDTFVKQDADGQQVLTPWIVRKLSKLSLLTELQRQISMGAPQATMWRQEDQTMFEQDVNFIRNNVIGPIDTVLREHAFHHGFKLDEPALANLGSDSLDATQVLKDGCARLDVFFKPLWVKLDHTEGRLIHIDPDISFHILYENLHWWLGDRAYNFQLPAAAAPSTAGEAKPQSSTRSGETPAAEGVQDANEQQNNFHEDSVLDSSLEEKPVSLPIIPRPKPAIDSAITGAVPRRFVSEVTKKARRRDGASEAPIDEPVGPRRVIAEPLRAPAAPYEGTVAVDALAHTAFQVMNLVPGTAAGQIEWTDVLHAMQAIGFTAEQSAGVIWKFQRGERSITAHRPHPGSKWAKEQAQRFGRRLNRTYGFTKETFVLKEE